MTDTNKAQAYRYLVFWEKPGCLPESQIPTLTQAEAREALADELDREANESECYLRAESYADAAKAVRFDDEDAVEVDGYLYEYAPLSPSQVAEEIRCTHRNGNLTDAREMLETLPHPFGLAVAGYLVHDAKPSDDVRSLLRLLVQAADW